MTKKFDLALYIFSFFLIVRIEWAANRVGLGRGRSSLKDALEKKDKKLW